MTSGKRENGRPVTMARLKQELKALRREVRIYVAIGIVLGPRVQDLLGTGVANAATRLIGH